MFAQVGGSNPSIQYFNLKNKKMCKIESIKFANFLISDFEMDNDEKGNLVWRLAGTNEKYTTEEMYEEFIKNLKAKNK